MRMRKLVLLLFLAAVAGVTFLMIACSSSSTSSPTAAVSTTISDPATCTDPQGPYSHVYVTITDVEASTSSSAAAGDSSFVDLTPGLSSNPKQIDLLGMANNQCFLATLGSSVELQAGNYQQIRVFLLDNAQASKLSSNQCGASAANCVVLGTQPNTPYALQLSSESQTGIKIPSGQIAGGQFVVGTGQVKDLNIDFNTCCSIVVEGSNMYRLNPVLHAGEVSTTSSSITGTVVDKATNQPIVGGNTVAALEQVDSGGIDRVIMQTLPDSSGNFVFCPVPNGTYDVVVAAVNGSNVGYAATVTTGVQPGNALGNVPLVAETGGTSLASITGQVTTSTGSAGTSADLTVTALQQISSSVLATIPLAQQSASMATLTTAAGNSCPATTDCASYTLAVPGANPNVGAFSTSGTTYTQTPGNSAAYTIDAQAFVPSSGGTADCSPSELRTSTTTGNAALTVSPAGSATASTVAFSGCQ